ncbi:hypothetical protein PSHT_00221 [Puccinia striiformis]|uniref:Uncharacterized protein n=1 Tax=Puccinia striiformis TaxID=27350 RepID=A0A2S4WNI0_9BASI|nr:hypothetical protein KEM48_000477 [Puccinia striiformis f. sp. tritici PST-130]POW23322.1 hypothetical protein PSHT_00221 [Puccinia striiformis]
MLPASPCSMHRANQTAGPGENTRRVVIGKWPRNETSLCPGGQNDHRRAQQWEVDTPLRSEENDLSLAIFAGDLHHFLGLKTILESFISTGPTTHRTTHRLQVRSGGVADSNCSLTMAIGAKETSQPVPGLISDSSTVIPSLHPFMGPEVLKPDFQLYGMVFENPSSLRRA